MAFVNHICKILPEYFLGQDQVREMGKRMLKGKVPFLEQALGLFTNAGVENRYLVRDIFEILDHKDLGWRNGIYKEACVSMGIRLMEDLFRETGLRPEEIDLFISTSCTGFMIPAMDAHIINHFRMKQGIKRLPLTELGCAAGAMALTRANDYLKAFPGHKVIILSVELPSLTYQTDDFRVANLVSAALFGDGGAVALLSEQPSTCELLEGGTHFFYDTPELMGFELTEKGFQIILDKKISELVLTDFVEPVTRFLERQNLSLEDIKNYVFHPGGRRIMDSLKEVLAIEEEDIAASRKVLREAGNLSSASILWVLEETMKRKPQGLGLMAAFGPGFNAELLTANFTT